MRRLAAAVLLATILGLALAGTASAPASARVRITFCPKHWVAHRGEGWPSPNTDDSVRAIRAAIADPQAYGVESDAWVTSDGRALMMHADNLARSTDGHGLVSDYTLSYLQHHVTMKDGSRPEAVYGYLRQVVTAHQHAILHLKSKTYDNYIDRALTRTGARDWVRPMATTLAQAKFFVARGWYTELLVGGVPTKAAVAAIKAARVKAVLVVDPSGGATPRSWIEPYLKADVNTDYVSYSAAQNMIINKYPFNRVLTSNIDASATASKCPARRYQKRP